MRPRHGRAFREVAAGSPNSQDLEDRPCGQADSRLEGNLSRQSTAAVTAGADRMREP